MSDQPPGPGWWQASDGRWYPPAPKADRLIPPPPDPEPPKRFNPVVPLMLVGIFGFLVIVGVMAYLMADGDSEFGGQGDIGPATSAAGDDGPATSIQYPPDEGPDDDPNPGALFPDRPVVGDEDQEREVGDAARLSGYTALVEGIEDVATADSVDPIGPDENALLIRVSVRITKRDDSGNLPEVRPYDWKLQTSSGDIIDVTIPDDAPQALQTTQLDIGDSVEGQVFFETYDVGPFHVIYTPDTFEEARGVWEHTRR